MHCYFGTTSQQSLATAPISTSARSRSSVFRTPGAMNDAAPEFWFTKIVTASADDAFLALMRLSDTPVVLRRISALWGTGGERTPTGEFWRDNGLRVRSKTLQRHTRRLNSASDNRVEHCDGLVWPAAPLPQDRLDCQRHRRRSRNNGRRRIQLASVGVLVVEYQHCAGFCVTRGHGRPRLHRDRKL